MTSTESLPKKSLRSWLVKPGGWLLTTLKFLLLVVLIWATAAIYWSNLPWGWARLVLALALLAFGIYALWVKPNRRTLLVFAAILAERLRGPRSFSRPLPESGAALCGATAAFLD